MYPEPRIARTSDGRVLTLEDAGPESGFPVLVHNGGGSRHVFPPAVREAHRLGLRLIGYDRPAYGGSTPRHGRTVADCASDVAAVLAELGITRIAVWGFSGGGPYALATAALLPEIVAAVCLFAPLGPFGTDGLDFLNGMADSYREEVRIFFEDRAAARAKFRVEAAEMHERLSRSERWLELWGDRAGTDPAHGIEVARYLADCHRDGWTRGDEGWWDDWSAFLSPWGFDLASIKAPIRLWHGLSDDRCPPGHSRWLVERLPNVTAHFPERDDHATIEENYREAGYRWLASMIAPND